MKDNLNITPGQTILFIGDSITDADRNSRAYKPFGFGYVHFIANFLLAKYPTYNLNIINRGISGNTIRDLKSRWQKDVVAKLRSEASKHSEDPHVVFPKRSEGKVMGADHKPDILSILIGVNDVWRRFAGEEELPYAVFQEEYESTYRLLLAQVKEKCNSRLVICEPFMFCDDLSTPMFRELRRYIETVRRIAAELVRRPCGGFDAVLVPFQKSIDEQISQVPPQNWSDDSVHPHLWAHSWLAQQWLISTGLSNLCA
jgi:lysophospholipase L1-like esterase